MGSEEQNQGLPEAGWYQDPNGPESRRRYWDGSQWTSQYRTVGEPNSVNEIDRRFPSLFKIARILHALGWVTVVLGSLAVVLGTIAAAESGPTVTRDAFGQVQRSDPAGAAVVIAIGGSLAVAFYALAFFGAAALIRLSLRVEDNTFRTASAVERLVEGKLV